MNKEEILAMEAGKKLNLLIAEKVIGLIAWEEKRGEYLHIVFQKPDEKEPYKRSRNWESEMNRYRLISFSEIDNFIHVVQEIKSYSSDITAAWEVVTEIQDCLHLREHGEQGEWEASFCGLDAKGHGETAALAICRAALLAVMDS